MNRIPFKIDPKNVVRMLDRIAIDIPEHQWIRELVENALAAGASHIAIDAWNDANHPKAEAETDADGGEKKYLLIRISDNGHGMDQKKLVDRIQEVFDPTTDKNFGAGARLSTRKQNPDGVAWVSKVAGKPAAMVITDHDGLRLEPFDEQGRKSALMEPDKGMLPKWVGDHGTSVILYGDGSIPTWPDSSYFLAQTLSRRYWDWGEVRVQVRGWHHKTDARLEKVPSFSEQLPKITQHKGSVTLNGGTRIDWYIFDGPPGGHREKRALVKGGVCVRFEDEIYDWGDGYRFSRFGVHSTQTQSRVLLAIYPAPGTVETNLGRSRLVTVPSGKNLPWARWAAEFVEQMPPEIRNLTPTSAMTSLKPEDLERRFNRDWRNRIALGNRAVKSQSKQEQPGAVGGDCGELIDVHGTPHRSLVVVPPDKPDKPNKPDKPDKPDNPFKEPVERRRRVIAVDGEGTVQGTPVRNASLPHVTYVDEDQWDRPDLKPYDFEYVTAQPRGDGSTGPILRVRKQGAAIQSQIRHWSGKYPDFDADTLVMIVGEVYGFEVVSKIIHFYDALKDKDGWLGDVEADILTPQALTIASLGLFSLDDRIETALQDALKVVPIIDEELAA